MQQILVASRRLISLESSQMETTPLSKVLPSKPNFCYPVLSRQQTSDFKTPLVAERLSGCDTNCGCSGATRATCRDRDHLTEANSAAHSGEASTPASCLYPFHFKLLDLLGSLWCIPEAICLYFSTYELTLNCGHSGAALSIIASLRQDILTGGNQLLPPKGALYVPPTTLF